MNVSTYTEMPEMVRPDWFTNAHFRESGWKGLVRCRLVSE